MLHVGDRIKNVYTTKKGRITGKYKGPNGEWRFNYLTDEGKAFSGPESCFETLNDAENRPPFVL